MFGPNKGSTLYFDKIFDCLDFTHNKNAEYINKRFNMKTTSLNSSETISDGVISNNRVAIPDGITRIAPADFFCGRKKENTNTTEDFPLYQYDSIDTLVIPSSVDIPHNEYFSPFASYRQRSFVWNNPTDCRKIHISNIENHSPHLAVEDGVLYSADKSRLIYCFRDKTSFQVPESVTAIEPFAFCLQEKLEKIVLHNRITHIGCAAFMACSSLTEIIVPESVKRIEAYTFDDCTALRKVVLPDDLRYIGQDAFCQCKALEEIRLPDALEYVNSFEGCSALREIEIPARVENIGGFLFCSSLRKVILHKGVKRISGYAFRYCDNLAEINFPEGIQSIGARAFYPASLTELIFPASLREIESEAFYYNDKLHYVKFNSCVGIDQAAFACCPSLSVDSISKPDDMKIKKDVFIQDTRLDKYGFWD